MMSRRSNRSLTIVAAVVGVAVLVGLQAAGPAAAAPTQVRDELGKRSASTMNALPPLRKQLAKRRRLSQPCGPFGRYGGGFYTNLGAGWTFLAARTGPCRAARARGGYGPGRRWKVKRQTHGEEICYGRSVGKASDVWYLSRKGWSWSGGTANPDWNESC